MNKFVFKFWPILFIFIVWLTFSYPYFFQNKVPYSSTYQVNHFFPWSGYPKYHGPVKNGAMPDITDQIYPWRHFTIESWKKGEVPFWNPNSFSGNPHLANYQSAVFSPLNLLFFVFPFVDAWSMLILLQPLLAGLFIYLLLREYKISKESAALGSLAFMFCGFLVVWMAYGTLSHAILSLPLSMYAIERWFNRKDKTSLALLLLSIPLSFFSGHFQTSLYFFGATFAYLAFKVVSVRKTLLPIIISFLLGFVIALAQILPSIQFYLESTRSGIFLNQGGIPLFYLVNLFAPDFFGNPVTRNDWFGYYAEWASFVGIIPLFLALLAFSIKNKKVIFFFLLGLVSLILSVDSPLQKFITDLRLPVISTSNPTRIIVILSFSLSILAGFGFERLKEYVEKASIKKVLPLFVAMAFLILGIWFLLFVSKAPSENLEIARRNFVLPTIIFAGFSALVFVSSIKKQKIILYLILILVAFDSLRFAQKWMPFDPKELVFPDTPVITGIRENIGFGRIFGNFGANLDTYYGFPSVEGYDPLYIERYGEFIRSSWNGEFTNAERSVVKLSRRGEFTDRALDLLGVSLIFHPVADTNQSWAYPVWENKNRFVSLYNDGNFEIYRNHTALERARLFYNYEVIKDKEEIISRFYNEDFDFRDVLILEEEPEGLSSLDQRPEGSVQIISYSPNKVIVEAETEEPALLFLSDNFYPGWKAVVNAKEVRILRADYSFRAIVIPSGKSVIEFAYKPF
jgi:hypothetical protein